MGFYIRKSKKVGPFRINLSKSGLGVSAGVKGLRVSTGPKGTYLNAGRGGIYYRQKLGGNATNRKNTQSVLNKDGIVPLDAVVDFSHNKSYSHCEGSLKIKKNQKITIVLLCMIIISFICALVFNENGGTGFAALMTIGICCLPISILCGPSTLKYSLTEIQNEKWNNFCEAFNVAKESKLTYIQTNAFNRGKSTTVNKIKVLKHKHNTSASLNVNVRFADIKCNDKHIVFLPNGIVINKPFSRRFYDYESMYVQPGGDIVCQKSSKLSDAEIDNISWLHSTKDGSADLRFKDNPMSVTYRIKSLMIVSDELNFQFSIAPSKRGSAQIITSLISNYLDFYKSEDIRFDSINGKNVIYDNVEHDIQCEDDNNRVMPVKDMAENAEIVTESFNDNGIIIDEDDSNQLVNELTDLFDEE